ncbi:hypothetical protein SJAV_13190 [Sulfurisphaera javensis]|uniref:Uncharacterized protein n=1 Tax=Sulfurisphaera javensis TaxID=2049879 RepID=A0AAT9GR98_9CREN
MAEALVKDKIIFVGKKKIARNSNRFMVNIPSVFIGSIVEPGENVYVFLRHPKIGLIPLGNRKIVTVQTKTGKAYYVYVPKEILEFLKIFEVINDEFEIYIMRK